MCLAKVILSAAIWYRAYFHQSRIPPPGTECRAHSCLLKRKSCVNFLTLICPGEHFCHVLQQSVFDLLDHPPL